MSGPVRKFRFPCASKSLRRYAGVGDFLLHPCYIGGCFGGKGDFMDVPVCYLLSLKSGRLKMVMDYSEEFMAGNPRHGAVIRVKTGVNKDGRLIAHRMDYVYDSGAYGAFKPQGYLVGPKEAAGPYNIPNVYINEKIVYTNKFPAAICARRESRKAFLPTSRRWIWWRAGWAWIRSHFD